MSRFFPISRREIFLVVFALSSVSILGFAVSMAVPDPAHLFRIYPTLIGFTVIGLCFALMAFSFERERVDIWASQQELMRISGQPMPGIPMVTPTSLRYLGLMAEELGETVQANIDAMSRAIFSVPGPDRVERAHVERMIPELKLVRSQLDQASACIATRCKLMPQDLILTLSPGDAVEIADGATDMTVIAAGYALASGIPGPACYTDVVGSNLSKADPKTGLIAKDSTGKWIKGSGYQPPNLYRVLSSWGSFPPPPV